MNSTTATKSPLVSHLSMAAKVAFVSVRVVLIFATVFGNSLVFKAFFSFVSLRTVSNSILVSLAAANSFMVVVFMLNIATDILDGDSMQTLALRSLCRKTATLNLLTISVIILHLALISVERLIAIKFSLRYHTLVTKRRALIASVVVWLWGVAVTTVFPYALKAKRKKSFNRLQKALSTCYKKNTQSLPDPTEAYLVFLVSSLLVIPILIIVASYSYIFAVSYKHHNQIHNEATIQGAATMKREMKGARTVAIVVGMCLVSFLPLLVVTCCRLLVSTSINKFTIYVVYFIASLTACWNPLIFCWRNENFRNAFRRILKLN